MAVITISRQYGSGGDEIAARVCDILGYNYFDKTMMAMVASESGISDEDFVDFSEDTYKMRGFLDRLLGRRVTAKVETWQQDEATGKRTLTVQKLDEAQGSDLVRSTILAAYERGNVLVLGRGGQAILKEEPNVLHIRVVAPMGARVLRIQDKQGLSLDEAHQIAILRDQTSAEYLQHFFDIEPDNPALYHLIVNTGKWDIESAAQIIVNALSHLPRLSVG
ncbi:MAG: cytidylate kinase-like family protein [Anaerolineae bacterium]|nr:cytidylate kinase-like family protein [Anaerolineae bacterium]